MGLLCLSGQRMSITQYIAGKCMVVVSLDGLLHNRDKKGGVGWILD